MVWSGNETRYQIFVLFTYLYIHTIKSTVKLHSVCKVTNTIASESLAGSSLVYIPQERQLYQPGSSEQQYNITVGIPALVPKTL